MVTRNVTCLNMFQEFHQKWLIILFKHISAAGRIWAPCRCRLMLHRTPSQIGAQPALVEGTKPHVASAIYGNQDRNGSAMVLYGIFTGIYCIMILIVYVCVWLYTYLSQSIVPNEFFFGGGKWSNGCLLDLRWSVWETPRHQAAWPLKVRVRGSGSITAHHTCKILNISNNNE